MTMLDPEIIERARAVDMLVVAERHGLQLAKLPMSALRVRK
jgi:hypothetical protein